MHQIDDRGSFGSTESGLQIRLFYLKIYSNLLGVIRLKEFRVILFELLKDGRDNSLPAELGFGFYLILTAIDIKNLNLLVIKENRLSMLSYTGLPV